MKRVSSALFTLGSLNAVSPNFFPVTNLRYTNVSRSPAPRHCMPVHGLLESVETPASRRQFSE
jgi:hypothetical protein